MWLAWLPSVALVAAEQNQTLLKKLDPASRTSVVLALVGLAILGAGMILLVTLGAHYVRRLSRERPPKRPRDPSDWSRKRPADGDDSDK